MKVILMSSLDKYILVKPDDPAVEKLRNIIRKIRNNMVLDIDEMLLLYDYFPELYREYMVRWFK